MALDENNLEKKFDNVSNSQDSIQSLSLWILHHKNHFKKIVQIWMKALMKAKASHRLTLFYLANDVIQHAKKKNVTVYVEEFAEVLREATTFVREDKIRPSVGRVFNIWQERNVYPVELIDELRDILHASNVPSKMSTGGGFSNPVTNKIVAEFKLSTLVEKMKKLKKVESSSKSKIEAINCSKLEALSCEVLNHLKDKSHGEQYSREFEEATKHLDSVVHALEREIAVRTEFVEALEKSAIFYDTQKDEAKIVANAYRNFAVRVKGVKRKLCESKEQLPSPLPSPCADAPSPTNSDDGPVLPGMDASFSHIKALMNCFNDSSSSGSQQPQISSLDKRLSNLMHNIPGVHSPSNHNNSSNHNVDYNTPDASSKVQQPSHLMPQQLLQQPQPSLDPWTMQNPALIQPNSYYHQQATKYLQQPPPPPPPPPPPMPAGVQSLTSDPDMYSQVAFEYDYTQSIAPVTDPYNIVDPHAIDRNSLQPLQLTQPQPIQAVISSRSDGGLGPPDVPPIIAPNLRQYDEYVPVSLPQARENFEPADMDLGNSDDEEAAANRLQNQQQRVLKVIETRRIHMPPSYGGDGKVSSSPLRNDSVYSNDRSSVHHQQQHHHHQQHHRDSSEHHHHHQGHHDSPMSNDIKATSRLLGRGSSGQHDSDERQRWRNPRPSGSSSHYDYDGNNGRQWKGPSPHQRTNSNSRRGSFGRRY